MNKDIENIQFLKDAADAEIILPESLSKENITKLILPEKQKVSKKGMVRRFVAIGAAACVMITAGALLYNSGFDFRAIGTSPETAEDDNAAQNAMGDEAYSELLSYIKAYGAEYVKNNVYFYSASVTVDDALIDAEVKEEGAAVPSVPSVNQASGSTASVSADGALRGELNLREENVFEDDIFINDGAYLYYINEENGISIVKAEDDGTLTVASVISKQRPQYGNYSINGLYKYKDYLIECYSLYLYNSSYTESENHTGVNIYDVSDAAKPELVKNSELDGYYSSSRIVDGKLILIGTYGITEYFTTTDDSLLLPACYSEGERTVIPAENIICDKDENPESYVLVMTASLDDLSKEAKTVSILGHSTEIYCTRETLYILGTSYAYSNVSSGGVATSIWRGGSGNTEITAIDISGDTAVYKNKTETEGTILNSYSIDEYNGYLRMAVNKPDENLIVVLDKDFNKVGEISGIAKGEQIKSVRFMGNTAYVVTFVQTDPLFVIDLTDPSRPEIKGEVKLPGFSSYLHPAGDGLLVGIGVGGTESGVDGSAKISLFDVSDPCAPGEIDNFIIENASFETTPKAYTSVGEGSFLIPYTVWGSYINGYSDGRFRTGAMLFEVKDNKLISKTDYCALSPSGTSRATFIDDTVYIYSGYSGIASFDMETGEYITSINGNYKSE